MNGVRDDNERNEKKADGEAGVALSQAELDALFSGRQAAELLKKINAQSTKEITVVYGKAKCTGADIDSFKQGTVIELNRSDKSAVDILCDGKLIACGFAGKSHGKATVKITTVFQQ
jgi:flagellar motor switch/type III secretory pathway protein FliN